METASEGKGRFEKISWRKAELDHERKEERRTGVKESSETRGSSLCKECPRT